MSSISPQQILDFLLGHNGIVTQKQLMAKFRPIINSGGPNAQKAFINAINQVASVKNIDGVKYVEILRKVKNDLGLDTMSIAGTLPRQRSQTMGVSANNNINTLVSSKPPKFPTQIQNRQHLQAQHMPPNHMNRQYQSNSNLQKRFNQGSHTSLPNTARSAQNLTRNDSLRSVSSNKSTSYRPSPSVDLQQISPKRKIGTSPMSGNRISDFYWFRRLEILAFFFHYLSTIAFIFL